MAIYDVDEARAWFGSDNQRRQACLVIERYVNYYTKSDEEVRYLSKLLWLLEGGEPWISTDLILSKLEEPCWTVVNGFFDAVELEGFGVDHWIAVYKEQGESLGPEKAPG